jgi:hypothetical protein
MSQLIRKYVSEENDEIISISTNNFNLESHSITFGHLSHLLSLMQTFLNPKLQNPITWKFPKCLQTSIVIGAVFILSPNLWA